MRLSAIAALLTALLLLMSGNASAAALDMDRAMEIASALAVAEGFEPAGMKAGAKLYEYPATDCLFDSTRIYEGESAERGFGGTGNPSLLDEREKELLRLLEGRKYWAVIFRPVSPEPGVVLVGGEFCVLIDYDTAEVITTTRGE